MSRGLALLALLALAGCGRASPSPPHATDTATTPPPGPVTYDADGDGHDDPAHGGDDCDDSDAEIYPGAPRICGNGIDDDCDGASDCDLRGDLVLEDVATAAYWGEPGDKLGERMAVGDRDGDGNADLLIASGFTDQTLFVRGPLDAGTEVETFTGGKDGARLGDLDGDGMDDVITTSEPAPYYDPVTWIWYAGSEAGAPDAELVHPVHYVSGQYATFAADMDGDGVMDLVNTYPGGDLGVTPDTTAWGALAVYAGPQHGEFGDEAITALLGTSDAYPRPFEDGVAIGDLTGDGIAEVAFVAVAGGKERGGVHVASGPLPGSSLVDDTPLCVGFDPDTDESYGTPYAQDYWKLWDNVWGGGIAIGDLDGDGQNDVAVSLIALTGDLDHAGETWLVAGPFDDEKYRSDALAVIQRNDSLSLALPGDVDGDGDADVVLQNSADAESGVLDPDDVEIAYAPRGFVTAEAFLRPAIDEDGVRSVASPGDVNGDGLADFLASTQSGSVVPDGGGAWLIEGRPTGF